MADVPVQAIVDALAVALRGITKANDYNTDLGLNVLTEPVTGEVTEPRCTVVANHKAREEAGNRRPGIGRTIRGLIAFEVPASYKSAQAASYAAEEDVDRLLKQYHQMPGALPVQYEESVFLNRPDGMAVVGVEIHWSTGYRSRGEGD